MAAAELVRHRGEVLRPVCERPRLGRRTALPRRSPSRGPRRRRSSRGGGAGSRRQMGREAIVYGMERILCELFFGRKSTQNVYVFIGT